MLGALAGDVIGSAHEGLAAKTKRFEFFHPYARVTDDSVLTVAVAQALLTGEGFAPALRRVGREYPTAGYGGRFLPWLFDDTRGPYHSWGNGAAMRAAPVGWFGTSETEVLDLSFQSAAVTHDHPEGIRGAQAVALAVYLARTGSSKAQMARRVAEVTGYDLARRLQSVRKDYDFQVRSETSVPEALIAFLESRNFNDALRGAVSLGGDADTQACIAGAVAEAYYGGVPEETARFVLSRTPPWLVELALPFLERFGPPGSADQLRRRWSEIGSTLRARDSFSVEQISAFPDALDVNFVGPRFALGGENVGRELAALVLAGWTRLHLDLSRVGPLTDDDLGVLEFVRQSCRMKWGLLAVTGKREIARLDAYADRSASHLALDQSRGKGRMEIREEGGE